MANSKNLGLAPATLGASALEHHIRNRTQALDLFVGGAVQVLDITATPPGSPANGDCYIVATSGTGDWAGQDGKIAYWLSDYGAWQFAAPWSGLEVRIVDLADTFYWDAVRSKWLGHAIYTLQATDPALAVSGTYMLIDGVIRMSANIGWQIPFETTVVGLHAYKADTAQIPNNQLRFNGSNVASLPFPNAADSHMTRWDLSNDVSACVTATTDAISARTTFGGGLTSPEYMVRWYLRRRAV